MADENEQPQVSGGGYQEELEREFKQTDINSHASRLIAQEIERLTKGEDEKKERVFPLIDLHLSKPQKVTLKVRIPIREHPRYNFVGKLLGPKGETLKAMQQQTGCKMAIMGKGSMREKDKEESLRKEGGKYAHLNEELHVLVEAFSEMTDAYQRVTAGLIEVKKFLVPEMQEEMYGGGGDMGEMGMNGGGMRGRGGYRGGPPHERGGGPPMRGGPPRGGPPPRGAPRGSSRGAPVSRGAPRGNHSSPGSGSYDAYGSQSGYRVSEWSGDSSQSARGYSGGGYDDYSRGSESSYYPGSSGAVGYDANYGSGSSSSYGGESWSASGGKSSANSRGGSGRGQTRSHPYSRPSASGNGGSY